MSQTLEAKLRELPTAPGVYIYKDKSDKIIYVGKAVNLRNRVRQYFQNSRNRDVKTNVLVKDIRDVDVITVDSEIEALFLESELIKRYMPKYNIELRDDKHYQYVRIDFNTDHPTVQIVRRPLDDGAEYFGPYMGSIRPALKLLRRIFPFDYKRPSKSKRASLDYHIGLSPGLEAGKGDLKQYKENLRNLRNYLRGERVKLEAGIKRKMESAAKRKHFERAAVYRNQLRGLKNLKNMIVFSDKELFDISKDQALSGLQELLNINGSLKRIEGYDISHQSGTNNVASMVVFTNGVSDKHEYRKFRMKTPGNDDFAHMREVIHRRFSLKNLEQWPKPNLIIIDGGKGQLSSALEILDQQQLRVPAVGLAKRYETIIVRKQNGSFKEIQLDKDSHILKLLMRIRDEAHRFAVSYHSSLKIKGQTTSVLEQIPTVGPATRKKLLKTFGSVKGLQQARDWEIEKVVGQKKAALIKMYLGGQKRSERRSKESEVS